MGRASNRKKAERQTGQSRKPDLATQRQINRIMVRLQALTDGVKEHLEHADAARRTWAGGTHPIPAKAPRWPDGSLGGRFFSHTFLREARKAPPLADADIPAPAIIAADSAYWNVATNALIRAVAYDGLGLDHPAVSALLEILTPIAETELASKDEFPTQDGPVFLLGMCTLRGAVAAAVGDDSPADIRGVLAPALDAAIPSLDGQAAADALLDDFAQQQRDEQSGIPRPFQGIGSPDGDALPNLVRAGAVRPADVLPVGLTMLSVLAQLCRSDSPSLL